MIENYICGKKKQKTNTDQTYSSK